MANAPLPRISIVTPCYQHAAYIGQTIESVLGQGYPDLEYIVIDGGSTDGSADIIRRYAPRLAHWVSEPDRGQTHALNKGFSRATGQLRAYLNSDDVYLPGALEAVARRWIKAGRPEVIHGRCRWLAADGSPQDRPSHFGRITRYREALDVWGVWWQRRQWVQPEVFWSAEAAGAVGTFDESFHLAMDFDYWVRLLRGGARVERLDREVAGFRFAPGQKSAQAEAAAKEIRAIVRRELWDPAAPVPPVTRRRLQGRWLYDEVFRPLAERSLCDGESRARRHRRLAALCARHPQLLLVPDVRKRALPQK